METVLEGNVQVVGNNLRVTAQLSNVKDGYQLWSDTYNRKLEDVFIIQDDLAQAIVKALKIKLLGEKETQLVKHYTENIEAYNLYLKGRYFWNMRTGEGLNKAIENFEQAIQKDPKYALAYSGLADSYTLFPWYGSWLPKEAYPKARSAALRALELDNMLAEAHTSLAAIHYWHDWAWLAAEKEFKKAIELDPLSLIINTNLGDYLYVRRRYDEAKEQYMKTLEIDSRFTSAHAWLGRVYLKKGMFKEAIEEFQKTEHPLLAYAYIASGNKSRVLQVLEECKKRASQQRVDPFYMAEVYLGIGEVDLTFEALEKAYRERYPRLLDFIKDPLCRDLVRTDPRFKAFLKKMDLKE